MKSKDIFKKTALDDYSKEDNYLKIVNKINKKQKNRKLQFALLSTSLLFGAGLVFSVLNKRTNTEVDDSYFWGTIYADDIKYSLDDEVTICWNSEPMDPENLYYDFPYYLDNNETFTDYFGEVYKVNKVYSRGLKLDLKIEGENIEKIIYTINDSKGNTQLYRGISGELSDINPFGDDEVYYAHKSRKDYTLEDRQRILDSYGYTEKKAKDFTQEEFEELQDNEFEKRIQNPEEYFSQKPIISDKEWEFVMWDIINRGTSIEIEENKQDEKHALFITKILENINEYKDSTDFYAEESNPDIYFGTVRSPQGLAKAIAEETSITIQIVYKNGVVHEKTLTFNLVEIMDSYTDKKTGIVYEYKNTTLQGTIK